MTMITAAYTNNGVPATGLSATVRVWELTGDTLVVTDAAMTEVAGGVYKYNFSTATPGTTYAVRCDGSATLTGYDRYVFESFTA